MRKKKVMDLISFKRSWKEKSAHCPSTRGSEYSFGSESGKCMLQK